MKVAAWGLRDREVGKETRETGREKAQSCTETRADGGREVHEDGEVLKTLGDRGKQRKRETELGGRR